MFLMVLKPLLVCFALIGSAFALSDSEGTDFAFSFVRNADPNPDLTNQKLSITVMNGYNSSSCNVTLTYRETFEGPVTYKSISVKPLTAYDISIPSFYGSPFVTLYSPQNQFLSHDTLYVHSSCPVSILANNFDVMTGKGETFTVFPNTFAGLVYTFTLPPVILEKQYQQVMFLPTQGKANISLRIPDIGALHQFMVDENNGTSYIAFKSSTISEAITYHITSDAPIQIIAGVTCSGASQDLCDHICYMPQPIATSDCYYENVMNDDHVTELLDYQLYADISGTCPASQEVSLSDGIASQSYSISGQQQNNPLVYDGTTGGAFYVESRTASIHVTKYFDGSKRAIGSFITTVPSISQMIYSSSYFFTREPNSVLTISCSRLACSTIYLDDVLVFGANFTYHGKLSFGSESYYVLAQTVVNPGFHRLTFREESASRHYAYYIRTADNRYAYTGQINAPNVNITIPPSTTASPTTTAKTKAPTTSAFTAGNTKTTNSVSSTSYPPKLTSTPTSASTPQVTATTQGVKTATSTGASLVTSPATSKGTSATSLKSTSSGRSSSVATQAPPKSSTAAITQTLPKSSSTASTLAPPVTNNKPTSAPTNNPSHTSTIQTTVPTNHIYTTTSSSPVVTRLLCIVFLVIWL